jgi:hypothetical protein
MKCRYCDADTKLIEAHIIPEAFFKELKIASGPLQVLSSQVEAHPKRSHKGVYDSTILCLDCEKELGPFDNYAVEVFLSGKYAKEGRFKDDDLEGYVISKIDYRMLKLFFLSMLWRASVSESLFFNRISLGPYEEDIKRRLKAKDPGPASFIRVMTNEVRYLHDKPVMLQPYKNRFTDDKLTGYVIPFGRFKSIFIVDKKPCDFSPLVLAPNAPLVVVYQEWDDSVDAQYIRQLVVTNIKRRQRNSSHQSG